MRLYLSSFRCGNAVANLPALAGGDIRTALIANADDYKFPAERRDATRAELGRLTRAGLEPEEVDLRDYFGAPPDAVAGDLRRFGVVWARGGNAFILRRAFRQSGMDQCLRQLLDEDAFVYGGYSAGVVVLCPTLRGLHLMDDPDCVPHRYESAVIWNGLGLLSYAVIPHYRSVHPSSVAAEHAASYMSANRLEFRTMRDGEVIVIDGAAEHLVS